MSRRGSVQTSGTQLDARATSSTTAMQQDAASTKRRFATALVATVIVGFTASAALAYLTSVGGGSGSAQTAAMQAVLISNDIATTSSPLLPGGSGNVTLKIDNPNNYAVTLVSVVGSGPLSFTGGNGCTLENSGVVFADQSGLNVAIAASAADQVVTLTNAVSMASSAASGCQGATVEVPVTITVHTP
jgi:hypothetical protein